MIRLRLLRAECKLRHQMTIPLVHENDTWDAVVIGGGFYGASLALELKSRLEKVLMLEREPHLLRRASYANQARVHNGYHYPRSILTSLRSRQNYSRFCEQFPDAIWKNFTQVYAVARRLSKVNAQQFERFCRRIGARISPAPKAIASLFNPDSIEAAFVVDECAFDAVAVAKSLGNSLSNAGVAVMVSTEVLRIAPGTPNLVHIRQREAGDLSAIRAEDVFNCTYSGTNRVLSDSGLKPIPLKHELAELALVEVPETLSGLGVTVMDGPFFSVMPFPAERLHSFSHVRYTPHRAWIEDADHTPNDAGEVAVHAPPESRFAYMLRDAMRYVPSLSETTYVRSLWEVKTILPRSERDDSRPAFVHRSDNANVWSIVGAKIDGIYDVEASVRDALSDAQPKVFSS